MDRAAVDRKPTKVMDRTRLPEEGLAKIRILDDMAGISLRDDTARKSLLDVMVRNRMPDATAKTPPQDAMAETTTMRTTETLDRPMGPLKTVTVHSTPLVELETMKAADMASLEIHTDDRNSQRLGMAGKTSQRLGMAGRTSQALAMAGKTSQRLAMADRTSQRRALADRRSQKCAMEGRTTPKTDMEEPTKAFMADSRSSVRMKASARAIAGTESHPADIKVRPTAARMSLSDLKAAILEDTGSSSSSSILAAMEEAGATMTTKTQLRPASDR